MRDASTTRFPAWFWLLWIALSTLFFSLMHLGERNASADLRWQQSSAELLRSDSRYPPSDSALWKPIQLPFADSDPETLNYVVWLRLTVPASVSEQSLILAIPSPNFSQYALWQAGRELDQRGMSAADAVSLLRHPIAFEIPASTWNRMPANRHLLLRIDTQDPTAYIRPLFLGPAADLADFVASAQFMERTLVRAIMAMMAVMSFLMAIIHRMRYRQETVYGWYALGIFTWLLHTGQGQLETAPFASIAFWISLGYVTLPTFVVTSAIFTNRVIDEPQPRVEIPMLIGLVLGSSYIFVIGGTDGSINAFLATFWIPATIAVGSYNIVRMVQAARRRYHPDVLILLAATAVVLVVGVRDYLYNNLGVISGSSLYLKYAAGLVLVVFSFVLIRRFSSALGNAERSNRALQAQRDMDSSGTDYRRVMLEEHRLLEEQIDALLQSVASSDALDSVRRSLTAARADMQLISDALALSSEPDAQLLASLRQRLEEQATEHAVALNWQTTPTPATNRLQPHQLLSLGRFIQIASREGFDAKGIERLTIHSSASGTAQHLSITAAGLLDTTDVFTRRAQYQRMAAELGGSVTYASTTTDRSIELQWGSS